MSNITHVIIEIMCRAWWNRHADKKWDECPEAWKRFYRESMLSALEAQKKHINEQEHA